MTAKSHDNPYGVDQVPEWELWERAETARSCADIHARESDKQLEAKQRELELAAKIEAALANLRLPNGPPAKDRFGRLSVVSGVPIRDFAYDDRTK